MHTCPKIVLQISRNRKKRVGKEYLKGRWEENFRKGLGKQKSMRTDKMKIFGMRKMWMDMGKVIMFSSRSYPELGEKNL